MSDFDKRFLAVTDVLVEHEYNLLPFNRDCQVYEGKCGYITQATHLRDAVQRGLFAIVTRQDMSFMTMDAVIRASLAKLVVIQPEYIIYEGDCPITTVDDKLHPILRQNHNFLPHPQQKQMRAAWVTDIHCNFLNGSELRQLAKDIASAAPDVLLISGDIGEVHNYARYLRTLAQYLATPIYFVHGNHDFYRGSIQQTYNISIGLSCEPYLTWLGKAGVVELTPQVALIGHDGWADGRYGDYENSGIVLNDHILIKDLFGLPRKALLKKLNSLGDETAYHFRQVLPQALVDHSHVILVMHPPPFAEACRYRGHETTPDWLPYLACKAVGDVLLEIMADHPDKKLLVLCGHTHGISVVRPRENILVFTGGAQYGRPRVQQVLTI